MTSSARSSTKSMGPGAWIRRGWERLHRLPGGSRLFDRLLGAAIPYTGALGARVVTLDPGHAHVRLKDRRAVRNHLGSIHAIAMANLGELAGNLALASSMPDNARFIVKSLSIEYLKKAHGTLDAVCRCKPLTTNDKQAYDLTVMITDAKGDVVSTVRLETLVGPVK